MDRLKLSASAVREVLAHHGPQLQLRQAEGPHHGAVGAEAVHGIQLRRLRRRRRRRPVLGTRSLTCAALNAV